MTNLRLLGWRRVGEFKQTITWPGYPGDRQANNAAVNHDVIFQIQALFQSHGHHAYGEGVSQLDHALQCSALAVREGAPSALIGAAFLHDIGHFLHHDADAALAAGVDDRHEALGFSYLDERFGPSISHLVRLHVEAKRWLCFQDAAYHASLSPASQRSLALQGGVMTDDEAESFAALHYAQDAIRLRRWDDAGKVPELVVPPMAHFLELLAPLACGA